MDMIDLKLLCVFFFLTAKTSENYDKTTDTWLITKLKVKQVFHLHAITKYQNF